MKKETDLASKERLGKLEAELAGLEEEAGVLTTRWHAEKDKLGSEQKLKEQLEAAAAELEQATRRGEYQRAGELTYGRIPELEAKLKEIEVQARRGARRGGGHGRSYRADRLALDRRSG